MRGREQRPPERPFMKRRARWWCTLHSLSSKCSRRPENRATSTGKYSALLLTGGKIARVWSVKGNTLLQLGPALVKLQAYLHTIFFFGGGGTPLLALGHTELLKENLGFAAEALQDHAGAESFLTSRLP